MKTYVNVGWSQKFKVNRALLVYGETNYNSYPYRHPFVTLHDVVHEEGEVRLAAAQLVTPDMLLGLLADLGQSQRIEVLPEWVVARTVDTVVWWSPAKTRPMFFSDRGGDKALGRLKWQRVSPSTVAV